MRFLVVGLVGIVVAAGIVTHVMAAQQRKQLDAPPQILNLGSGTQEGSVSLSCTGKAPFTRLSCHVYSVWIARPSADDYNRSRAELPKDLASKTEAQFRQDQQKMCSQKLSDNDTVARIKSYSPGHAASARDAMELIKAMCGCATKDCFTKVMLDQQSHEQNECTIYNSVIPVDFVKVNDRKWVSNNGPEGICGVVDVFTIEHEPNDPILWTYTSHYSYTNNTQGLCKGLKDEDSIYAWRLPKAVRLQCDEFNFNTLPESR
jgi:hypothetical protein